VSMTPSRRAHFMREPRSVLRRAHLPSTNVV
jgi:hypothetical protein